MLGVGIYWAPTSREIIRMRHTLANHYSCRTAIQIQFNSHVLQIALVYPQALSHSALDECEWSATSVKIFPSTLYKEGTEWAVTRETTCHLQEQNHSVFK